MSSHNRDGVSIKVLVDLRLYVMAFRGSLGLALSRSNTGQVAALEPRSADPQQPIDLDDGDQLGGLWAPTGFEDGLLTIWLLLPVSAFLEEVVHRWINARLWDESIFWDKGYRRRRR